jgi:hypothetical protein
MANDRNSDRMRFIGKCDTPSAQKSQKTRRHDGRGKIEEIVSHQKSDIKKAKQTQNHIEIQKNRK